MPLSFDATLPRLVAAYEQGRLVPFIGAGMSVPACRDWEGLVRSLEVGAESTENRRLKENASPEEIIRAANWAVRKLKLNHPRKFAAMLRHALFSDSADIPAQTRALADIWWPLVLTTNYDDLYVSAWLRKWQMKDRQRGRVPSARLSVLGRRPQHCQQVLSSLWAPSEPIVWALQGLLTNTADDGTPYPSAEPLDLELVVGHEEYRRVTHTELHFRRAFAEIFRNRSLLFLGSGLRDQYLLELFGEILEMFGPNPIPHYAFIQEGEVDADFLRSRFDILVIEYPEGRHDTIPGWLGELQKELAGNRWRQTRWSFSLDSGRRPNPHDTVDEGAVVQLRRPHADLEIIRGSIPLPRPHRRECTVISAGMAGEGQPTMGDRMAKYREELTVAGLIPKGVKPAPLFASSDLVWGYPSSSDGAPSPVFYAVARGASDAKDLRVIAATVEHVLEWVESQTPYRLVRMPLLAAGQERRRYPPRFALVETVRGFARWRRAHPDSELRLIIHLVHPGVLSELSTGKIDVLQLLSSAEDIPFWMEVIVGSKVVERQLVYRSEQLSIGDLANEIELVGPHWHVDLSPVPSPDWQHVALDGVRGEEIRKVGILPGSTLRFSALEKP
ncbi:MAG: SIR2 family protein [Gemmatimonadota bacterium]|nr:SIR2 family protein [Gemmatimonadota bacterium]